MRPKGDIIKEVQHPTQKAIDTVWRESYAAVGEQAFLFCFHLMGSFGENLRRERELRGISLEEISQHTKLSTRMLEAIENDRFDLLPGGIFNRSFVLHYARYLGLDEARVAAEFEMAASPAAVDIKQVADQRKERNKPAARESRLVEALQRGRLLLASILVLALLLLVVYAAVSRGWTKGIEAQLAARLGGPLPAPPPLPRAPGPPPSLAGAAPVAAAGQPAPRQQPPAEQTNPSAPAPTGAAPAPGAGEKAAGVSAGGLVLQVDTPLEGAWVEVIADGQRKWAAEMRPGESRRVTAWSQIELRTGNAGAVILTLNGETQPPLGLRGEVKTVKFSPQDVKKP
jgi:cytoskeletal protein RodZ